MSLGVLARQKQPKLRRLDMICHDAGEVGSETGEALPALPPEAMDFHVNAGALTGTSQWQGCLQ